MAGALRMPWKRFAVFNALGAALWVTVISVVGYSFGSRWKLLMYYMKRFDQALVAAFWRYEAALMSNDVAALDDLFLNSEQTIRADHVAVLLGHDAIARFRASRTTGAPTRTIVGVHVRKLSDDTSLVLAETCRPNGACGLQTQVWTNTEDGWKVAYAHVSAGAPRDATIWRKVGAPLVAATAEGSLSGMSVAVKDLFAIAGESIGGGVPQYLEQAPIETANAHAVAALIGQGATVIGLAQTDELAYSLGGTNPHYGTPPNPAARDRIPGGSSSGPSVAVSSGEVDLGLGTDTAGSVRVPASYQGIYGLRPTHGVIDIAGGRQPMCSDDGRIALVFNGEIYNYRELRRALSDQGVRFHTASDTEVLLRLYERYGSEAVHYLRGMFAFAVWDGTRDERPTRIG